MLMECTGTKASTPLLLPIKVNGKMNKSLMVLYDLLRIIILFGETKPMNRLSLPSAYFGFVAIPLLFLLQVFSNLPFSFVGILSSSHFAQDPRGSPPFFKQTGGKTATSHPPFTSHFQHFGVAVVIVPANVNNHWRSFHSTAIGYPQRPRVFCHSGPRWSWWSSNHPNTEDYCDCALWLSPRSEADCLQMSVC